ncbi:ZIP zinc/iron transport family [Hesseltinella vesiculosa]|uniref:ZIP zinc/iron transport family n=1 Tax=Hesseltinella vesiculosa TaxID=101127 RepID=A0A1X2GQL2_9FUNG|nr:ZIP zinc/iron transport family [Hesseltinella vesiculosa]
MDKKAIVLLSLLTLAQAQDASVCQPETQDNYNLGLRIGSIFILASTSALGIFFPMIAHRISPYTQGSIRDWILTIGRFFGTGIILATAFVHMLPNAFNSFQSPCLTGGWLTYGAFAGIFCMLASFSLQLLEIGMSSYMNRAKQDPANEHGHHDHGCASSDANESDDLKALEHSHHGHGMELLDDDQISRHIGILILELGIVMHSVLIGIDLATTSADAFITLLIALVFHQFFEGLALGTRINDIKVISWFKMTVMGLIFMFTTPLGIAIGIGIHSSYNGNSYSAVLASAILDSLSAGILLYNAYVTLMSKEINCSAFLKKPASTKIVCLLSMYLGAALMSVIGEWA